MPGFDTINHPMHYSGKVEAIDCIESAMSPEEFRGYLRGNCLKYLYRAGRKGEGKAAEDLAKCDWYLQRLRKLIEKA